MTAKVVLCCYERRSSIDIKGQWAGRIYSVRPETHYLRFVIPDPDPESRFFSANNDAWIPVFTGMTF